MLVNSFIFWGFFLLVLLPYFTLLRQSAGGQNAWLLLASLVFYAYTDWRMLLLLMAAIIVFYGLGRAIASHEGKARKQFMVAGVVLGAGLLLYFKYLNFFVDQVREVLKLCGLSANWQSLNIIVPIGISFFTFKLISYVVEVYKKNIEAERDFVRFATYISFFPTILSGPIDRPNDFLPQLREVRQARWDEILEGMKRVLWGMFLKMCIADKVSPYTDAVFNSYSHHSALTIVVAAVLYSFQIYADFCGYSEMAIGVSRIMGLRVTENFRRPYLATNMGEFWRRWHISLMTWLRDYIYFPLGGSRCSQTKTGRNTAATFLVSGLWHGANWTFILWGLYHGILVFGRRLWRSWRGLKKGEGEPHSFVARYLNIAVVFLLCTLGWIMFRAASVSDFINIMSRLAVPGSLFFSWALTAVLPISILVFKDIKDEEGWNIHFLHARSWVVQAISMGLLIVLITYIGELEGAKFIYFQF